MNWKYFSLLILCFVTLTDALITSHYPRSEGQNQPKQALLKPIEKAFPLQWKASIGAASFKTNYILTNNKLYIGSNGKDFMDFFMHDKKSGVYALNRKNGQIMDHFANDVPGDMDVNGILYYKNKLYFGNDNEEIICTDNRGKEFWRKPISGDVEHEPVLLHTGKENVIIFATETGEIQAINPESGTIVWQYFTPGFEGWKPGDNRTVFKVRAYFYDFGEETFYTKPKLVDMNDDGIDDLIYIGFRGQVYLINGKNGIPIYVMDQVPPGLSRFLFGVKNQGTEKAIITAKTKSFDSLLVIEEISLTGSKKLLDSVKMEYAFMITVNPIVSSEGNVLFCSDNRLYQYNTNGKISLLCDNFDDGYFSLKRRSYLSSKIFRYRNHEKCIGIVSICFTQEEKKDKLIIFSLEENKIIEKLEFPSIGEMNPIIEDFTGDGVEDLLFSGYDGMLYCYAIPQK